MFKMEFKFSLYQCNITTCVHYPPKSIRTEADIATVLGQVVENKKKSLLLTFIE